LVSQHQQGETILDFNEAGDDQVSCSRQITTPAPHHSVYTGWMLFLMPSQQCKSTEGTVY